MTTEPSTQSTRDPEANRGWLRRPRGRLYMFLVTALAVFLVVLAYGRSRHREAVATIVLRATSGETGAARLAAEGVRDELIEPTALQRAVDHVKSNMAAAAGIGVDAVRDRLVVRDHSSATPGRVDFQVSFASPDADVAAGVVNILCEQLMLRHSWAPEAALAADQSRYIEAARAAEQADVEYEAAKARLEAFITSHFEQLNPPAARTVTQTSAQTVALTAEDDALRDARHRIEKLEEQLVGLRRTRVDLLAHMTTAHPRVKALADQIAELEEQLGAVRSALSTLARSTAASVARYHEAHTQSADAARKLAEAERRLDEARARQQELYAEYEQLQTLLARAEARREQLRLEEQQMWQRRSQRPAYNWHAEPATMAVRMPASNSLSLYVVATAAGLIFGSAVMFMTAGGPLTIDSAADAEAAVSAPVMGTITEPASSAPPKSHAYPFAVRFLVTAAEAVLVVALIAMLIAALMDRQFASHMGTNPLSALADSAGHLRYLLGS